MKREEKNQQSMRKILDCAMREFGEKSYGEASLNAVCAGGGISKGIIYHYFEDKDALYLACVRECFGRLTAYLSGMTFSREEELKSCIEKYFNARHAFFQQYPHFLGVFSSATSFPPSHLKERIRLIRADFDALSASILSTLLGRVRLRDGLTVEEVGDFLRSYQDFLNEQQRAAESSQKTMREFEHRRCQAVDLVLYGVVERRELP